MKILLTGAGGLIGGYLAKEWQKKFNEIIFLTRKNIASDIVSSRVICCDLSQGLNCQESVDVIVHAAAQSPAPGKTMEDYIRSNVDAVRNIVKYAKQYNVPKIIYLSSMLIYGRVEDLIVDESTPYVNPKYYGITKYMGEKLIEEAERNSTIALRLPGVLGMGAKTPWLVRTARKLKNNETVELFNPDALFNNMIHVSSLEKFIFHLIHSEWGGNKVVTVGCTEPLTVLETVNRLRLYLGSRSEINIVEADRKSFLISINSALDMGYQAMTADGILKLYSKDI